MACIGITEKNKQSFSNQSATANMHSLTPFGSSEQSDSQRTPDSVASSATAGTSAPGPQHLVPEAVALTSKPRLVVTAHRADGTSIIRSDEHLEPFAPFGPQASSFVVFDERRAVPATNQAPAQDFARVLPRSPPAGVMFCITNLSPGGVTPMHRTLSVDYCVVLTGEVVLELDGGDRRTVRAGEFVIQGGTNHRWLNQTDEVCRIAFMGVGAQKVRLASGEELEETVFQ